MRKGHTRIFGGSDELARIGAHESLSCEFRAHPVPIVFRRFNLFNVFNFSCGLVALGLSNLTVSISSAQTSAPPPAVAQPPPVFSYETVRERARAMAGKEFKP